MILNRPCMLKTHWCESGSCFKKAKYFLPSTTKARWQLFLPRVAEPVIRFRRQLLFHIRPDCVVKLFTEVIKLKLPFRQYICCTCVSTEWLKLHALWTIVLHFQALSPTFMAEPSSAEFSGLYLVLSYNRCYLHARWRVWRIQETDIGSDKLAELIRRQKISQTKHHLFIFSSSFWNSQVFYRNAWSVMIRENTQLLSEQYPMKGKTIMDC